MYQGSLTEEEDRVNVLRKLERDLASALPGNRIDVLTRDPVDQSFSRPVVDGQPNLRGRARLAQGDPLIEQISGGRPWAHRVYEARLRDGSGGHSIAMESVFPLMVQGNLGHVLVVTGGRLREKDVRLILAYCRQTALALETMALQMNLDHKIQRLATLVRLVDDLSIEQNYRHLLQTVLDQATELLLAEQGSIMLLEKETDLLMIEASRGVSREQDRMIRVPRGVGISGLVAASGMPILVEDIERDPRVRKKNDVRYKSPSFVSVPLKLGQQVVGVMNFNDKRSGAQFDGVDLSLAETCASHAAVVLDRRQIYELTARLTRQATIDDLTGLFNRACILGRFKEELARSERYSKLMSLLMLDVDGFKSVNDLAGHAHGDRVLRRVAETMASAVRAIDIIGRYGGDEFLIILPETDTYFAAHMAERVRSDIEKANITADAGSDGGEAKGATVSVGIATFPTHGTSQEVLLDHADEALYRAKAGGRNRVVVY